jgi:acetyl esterase/lipase
MQVKEVCYKQTESKNLTFKMFSPDSSSQELLPVVIFFFGGGWRNYNPDQFSPQCEELANNGIIGITAEYRVYDKEKGINAIDSNKDGSDAVDYVFSHAVELGIDKTRIAVGGGSSGGQIAAYIGLSRAKAATASQPKTNQPTTNQPVANQSVVNQSPANQPAAMVLFNPAYDLNGLAERHMEVFGNEDEVRKYSPSNYLCAGAPPTILFHGELDELIPYQRIVSLGEEMRSLGNIFEVHIYPGMEHGFFNFDNHDNIPYTDTTTKMLVFLKRIFGV